MAINLNDNINVLAGKATDARYLNNLAPYTSEIEVNTLITSVQRYVGLTVNINGVEYWYKDGIADLDLVIKTMGGTGTLTGATSGLHLIESGTSVVLGDSTTFTGATFGGGGVLKYASDCSSIYDARTLVDAGFVTGLTANLESRLDLYDIWSATTEQRLDAIDIWTGETQQVIDALEIFTGATNTRLDTIEADYITGATNGVCKYSDHDVCLGGTLSSPIIFTGSDANHLCYAADYSGGYTCRSIPDVNYVNNIASGLLAKGAVCAATTGATDFVYPQSGLIFIDGVQTTVGMRILVKDPPNSIDNGIWIANTGLWTRAGDFDGTPTGETVSGSYMWVLSGNTNKDTSWVLNTSDPIIVNDPPQTGDTPLNFVLYNHVQDVIAGIGITVSAITGTHIISVNGNSLAGNSILWSGNTFNVDVNSGTLQTALQNIDNDINYLSGVTSGNTEDIQTNFDLFTGFTASTQPIINAALTGVTSVGSGTTIYSGITGQTLVLNNIIGSGNTTVSKVDNTVVIYSSGGSGVEVFTEDILVSIAAGKTFGKYENGDTIPASGKTPAEVIMMALVESLEPTINLSSSAQNLAFGLSAKTVNLTFSYTINTLNAEVDTVLLEWRRGNTGAWSALTTNTGATTYNHTIYETNRFNTSVINYRYTVTDTGGGTGFKTYDRTPNAYAAPTFSPTYTNTGLQSYETNAIREKGNVNTTIAGTIDSNNVYVNITGYTVYRCVDGGAYSQLYTCGGLSSTAPISIASCLDTGAAGGASTVGYCIKIGDEYSPNQNGGTCTITFRYASFYGYCSNTSISGSEITALGHGALCTTRERTMVLTASGPDYTYVAYPELYGWLTSVILDGSAPILGAFTCSCDNSVTNYYGQTVDYILYKSNDPGAFTTNSVAFS